MADQTNSVNEEIIEQAKQVLEERTFIEKVKYFVGYYKIHALVVAAVLFLIGSVIYMIVSDKEELLQVAVVNGNVNVDYDTLFENYVKDKVYDEKKEDYVMDPWYHVSADDPTNFEKEQAEKLYVMAISSELDVILCDEGFFEATAEVAMGHDLSLVMSEEQMEHYKDLLYWYDCPDDSFDGIEAVGVDITDFPKIKDLNMFPGTKAYFVLILASPYPENALDFLEYLETP